MTGLSYGRRPECGVPSPKASAPAPTAHPVMAARLRFKAASAIEMATAPDPTATYPIQSDRMIPTAMAMAMGINGMRERGGRMFQRVAYSQSGARYLARR